VIRISPHPHSAMPRRAPTIVLALLALAAPAAAQDTTAARLDSARAAIDSARAAEAVALTPETELGPRFNASPPLPEEHWAARAAARAEALGLAPRYTPAQRAVPRQAVASALMEALLRSVDRPALKGLTEGWWARFVEEFPEYGRPAPAGVAILGRSASLGYGQAEGRIAPAEGYFIGVREEPRPIEDLRGVTVGASAGFALGRAVSVSASGLAIGEESERVRVDLTVGAGAFALSAGLGDVGYGYGRSGGVVLSPREPLPRVEVQTTRPIRLPWVLRYLGDVSAHTFFSRMDEDRHPTEPWMWGMRVAARPHPRFTLAVNRASIFGGEGRPETLERLAGMLVGVIHKSDFENQIVSGEVRWRLPTDAVLPATAYLEWGADDGSGAISDVPGQLFGLFLPALPGVPEIGVGGEYARFGEACCGHGPWYFNGTFPGNWARGDQALGHPLGGEGWEAAGYAQGELLNSRLRLDARLFVRDRSDASLETLGGGNLFTPLRTGRSTGGWVEAALRLFPGADLSAGWRMEDGDGWREQGFHAEVTVFP
jgi:hypothetical protein